MAQKSLDGEEVSPSSQEKKPKKSVGKSLDDSGAASKVSSGGKNLDDVGKTVSSDVRPEIKTKTENLIRIGPAAPEKVSPIPHRNNSKDRKDKPTNPPKEIVEVEKDQKILLTTAHNKDTHL